MINIEKKKLENTIDILKDKVSKLQNKLDYPKEL